MDNEKKSVTAFRSLENVFVSVKNNAHHKSNKHPLGDPNRIEHDLTEIEKEHLNLLTTNVHLEIANDLVQILEKTEKSNGRLAIVGLVLSAALVISAIIELFQ